ncbi:MAG: YHS domain-containing protein [Gammaproteobacteria bacterium]
MPDIKTVRDYVCLMDVNPGDFSYEFQDRTFSFCSQQCRDRFETNPHLYIGSAGKSTQKQRGENIIKQRILKLDEEISDKDSSDIIKSLKAMMGIKDVSIKSNIISITYDLLEVTTQQIENTLENSGKTLGTSFANKLKLAFIHYHEETQLDNLEYDNTSQGHQHHHS